MHVARPVFADFPKTQNPSAQRDRLSPPWSSPRRGQEIAVSTDGVVSAGRSDHEQSIPALHRGSTMRSRRPAGAAA